MSDGGKGSAPRKAQDHDAYSKGWDNIFGNKATPASVVASCGHELEYGDDGVFLTLREYANDGTHALSYGSYCPACAKMYAEEGYVLNGEAEEQKWLYSDWHEVAPVAYWNEDESTLAFHPGKEGRWVPLYTRRDHA